MPSVEQTNKVQFRNVVDLSVNETNENNGNKDNAPEETYAEIVKRGLVNDYCSE